MRVTRDGGYAAIESADGKTLCFAKRGDRSTWAVWKMPAEGGPEITAIPEISTWGDFDVTDIGIFFVDSLLAGTNLGLHRFSDGSNTVPGALQKRVSFGVSASPDNRVVLYTQFDQESTELMLVENFIRQRDRERAGRLPVRSTTQESLMESVGVRGIAIIGARGHIRRIHQKLPPRVDR